MTEKMYSDIFSKKMPPTFFENLVFVGGNTFQIRLSESGTFRDIAGKNVPIYEKEEELINIMERYGCCWQDDEDLSSDRDSRRSSRKKFRLDVPQNSW